MIIILKQNPQNEKVEKLVEKIQGLGIKTTKIEGDHKTILGLVGDTSKIDIKLFMAYDVVETVKRISEPYKAASRKFHPDDTLIDANGSCIGAGHFSIIAGPCSVESEEQLTTIAKEVKKSGAKFLRGGAFKPRTSPYSFQGLHDEGLRLLSLAKKETGLPIVTELMNVNHLDLFDDVDVIQVGARNMQNFEMLKELGRINKPILLKRGLANTIDEFLMSAEYILSGGNNNVILCERGIRTFETMTRNTLDLSSIPLIKERTHLPIVVDPSHATGISSLVLPMSKAAVAAGADGLMIEVHNDPQHALCDGDQSITPAQFDEITKIVLGLAKDYENKII